MALRPLCAAFTSSVPGVGPNPTTSKSFSPSSHLASVRQLASAESRVMNVDLLLS